MPFEIDFLPVGADSKSGDAIALRYGNLSGRRSEQMVVTIDGGTRASGEALVNHVQSAYGTDVVDLAILSHPDMDHASGMRCVLETLKVGLLSMHLPWNHSRAVKQLIDDERTTHKSLADRAEKNLVAANEIEEIATAKGIKIVEPFAGSKTGDGVLTVLGPTREFYQNRLANFRFMPGTDKTFLQFFNEQYEPKVEHEGWTQELLANPKETASSAENNSSTIILVQVDGVKILLTGDAGVPALDAAINFAGTNFISLAGINLFQVPHHGSRKNLSIPTLNRLFGGVRARDECSWTAIVSAAAKGSPKHPNKKITNALRRRGARVATTANGGYVYFKGVPLREGFGPVTPLPFYTTVEADSATE